MNFEGFLVFAQEFAIRASTLLSSRLSFHLNITLDENDLALGNKQ